LSAALAGSEAEAIVIEPIFVAILNQLESAWPVRRQQIFD
jgi:hypothetical protein